MFFISPFWMIDEYPKTFLAMFVAVMALLTYGVWYDATYEQPQRERETARWEAFRRDCIVGHSEARCWELWRYRFRDER